MPNVSHELMEFQFSKQSDSLQVELINSEPWFLAKDVCNILDLENVTKALYTLDEDEKLTLPVDRSGQVRNMNFINESGLYNLIFQSRKPEAKKFRKWVTNEVLPSIRKTGKYGAAAMPQRMLNSPGGILDMLEYCDRVMHEGEWYYAAIQLRVLFGKNRTGGTTAYFRKVQGTGDALKLAGGGSGQTKWYVRKQAIPKLLNIRPNNLINISILKAFAEEGGIK